MTKALIAGGGISGPVAAMALQKAGLDAAVYEAYDGAANEAGFFLNFASNGIDALRAIDVDMPSLVDGEPIPRMVIWSGRGRRLGTVANGVALPDGTVSICVRRADLQRALREEARRRGVPIVYGKRLVSVRNGADGVVAGFEDGTEATGSILVGADGIHSRTRRLIDPASARPTFTGLVGVGGYSRVGSIDPTPDTQHFVLGRRAFFGYLVRRSGEIYWFANIGHSETTTADLAGVSAQEWKQRLLTLFSDDLSIIHAIVANSTGPIGAHPVYDIPSSPVWHRGSTVIIGDASHATSPSAGQGASIACEDAIVLAQCLRDNPEATRAFAAFERLRRQRVERVVAYARKLGGNKTAGPVARVLRDLTMPVALRLFASKGAHSWMYTYHIDWTAPVTTGPREDRA